MCRFQNTKENECMCVSLYAFRIARSQNKTLLLVSGVGFNRSHDAGWIEHQEAFDQILAGLNADIRNGKALTSLTLSTNACLLYRHSNYFKLQW